MHTRTIEHAIKILGVSKNLPSEWVTQELAFYKRCYSEANGNLAELKSLLEENNLPKVLIAGGHIREPLQSAPRDIQAVSLNCSGVDYYSAYQELQPEYRRAADCYIDAKLIALVEGDLYKAEDLFPPIFDEALFTHMYEELELYPAANYKTLESRFLQGLLSVMKVVKKGGLLRVVDDWGTVINDLLTKYNFKFEQEELLDDDIRSLTEHHHRNKSYTEFRIQVL